MYITNMKLFLTKLTYTFLSCVVIIFVASCSILDYEEGQNKSNYSQNNVKKKTKISIKKNNGEKIYSSAEFYSSPKN